MEDIDRLVASCRLCEISFRRNKPAVYRGSKNPKILFVGEGPGKYEDMKGLPFVGPSGRLLDKELERIGIKEYGITNVVKCRPKDIRGQNRAPSEGEIKNCMFILKKQIETFKPKIIVAIGKVALKTLHDYNPIYVLHPSAALRNPDLLKVLRSHMDNVKAEYTKIKG